MLTERQAQLYEIMPPVAKIDESKVVLAPMPGLVKSVTCSVGDSVAEGQEVCVIEAMKMQNSLQSAAPATVKAVHCAAGDTVDESQLLIEFE